MGASDCKAIGKEHIYRLIARVPTRVTPRSAASSSAHTHMRKSCRAPDPVADNQL